MYGASLHLREIACNVLASRLLT